MVQFNILTCFVTLSIAFITLASGQEENDRPRSDQKSLMIVFDTTGSMSRDLEQLRLGANDIVNNFASREDNPIFNYILSLFNDPYVNETLVTRNPDEILETLNAVVIDDGGDCPELALQGLRNALEHSLDNSLAFLFSDASAKDHDLFDSVFQLIKKKQSKAYFLLTGNCGNPNTPAFLVYEKIAKLSGGQSFNIKREEVRDVLMKLMAQMEADFVSLRSLDFDEASESTTTVYVDGSFSRLTVSLSGKSAKLVIRDSKDEIVTPNDTMSAANLQIFTFDATDSVYTIQASSRSAYSLRIGGNSEMTFGFGFSLDQPNSAAETYLQPLVGHQNFLSIFPSKPSLVGSLTEVFLVPANSLETFPDVKIPLYKKGDFYTSELFDIPLKMFKIQISGQDNEGATIDRLISTGLDAAPAMHPEVDIDYDTLAAALGGSIDLNCVVKSLTPVKITWSFDSIVLKEKFANQSSSFPLNFPSFKSTDVGKYVCEAENEIGKELKEVSLSVSPQAPTTRPTTPQNSPCENQNDVCVRIGSGIIGNKRNCKDYYSCELGALRLLSCPGDLQFDIITARCENPETAEILCANTYC